MRGRSGYLTSCRAAGDKPAVATLMQGIHWRRPNVQYDEGRDLGNKRELVHRCTFMLRILV